ncbi:hypothetical protein FHL15_007595 [Xylaria flabelliformis]|uniref:Uncharacterized protein n=1 Tax=Xylaria flabelliformis TaxID=2512241 RepID=A0A553HUG0_9PEZI|nr:hypothetical protein FHL15_007595 [Xylaria flabelliformis]
MPLLSLLAPRRICIKTFGEDGPLTRERDKKPQSTDTITSNKAELTENPQSITKTSPLHTTEAKMAIAKIVRTLTGKSDKPLTPEEEAKKAAKKAAKEQKMKEKKAEEERKRAVEKRRRQDSMDRYENH